MVITRTLGQLVKLITSCQSHYNVGVNELSALIKPSIRRVIRYITRKCLILTKITGLLKNQVKNHGILECWKLERVSVFNTFCPLLGRHKYNAMFGMQQGELILCTVIRLIMHQSIVIRTPRPPGYSTMGYKNLCYFRNFPRALWTDSKGKLWAASNRIPVFIVLGWPRANTRTYKAETFFDDQKKRIF